MPNRPDGHSWGSRREDHAQSSLGPERPRPSPRAGTSASCPSPACSTLRANPCPEVTDPTSLTYIVLLSRGSSPWRPAVVMSTTRQENYGLPRIFKGRRKRNGLHRKRGALPNVKPSLRINRFQGDVQFVKEKRELFPGLTTTSPSSFA